MNTRTLAQIQSAIAEFAPLAGPVTFDVRENDDTFTLTASYPANTKTDKGEDLTDEPWHQFGGYKILDSIGDSGANAGMDSYTDKHGDEIVSQWVCISK